MLETFKALTECEDEVIANYYLYKATEVVKTYTKRNTAFVTDKLKVYIIDLAISYYNQRGSEGLNSISTNGISESYIQDLPQHIRTVLNLYRYFKQEDEEDEES